MLSQTCTVRYRILGFTTQKSWHLTNADCFIRRVPGMERRQHPHFIFLHLRLQFQNCRWSQFKLPLPFKPSGISEVILNDLEVIYINAHHVPINHRRSLILYIIRLQIAIRRYRLRLVQYPVLTKDYA